MLEEWAAQVPEDFTLLDQGEPAHHALHAAQGGVRSSAVDLPAAEHGVMGGKLGPILFQLPPNMKKDVDRLQRFLDVLPRDRRYTIEFRHESWFDDDVFAALREHDIAMCVDRAGGLQRRRS